MNQEIICTAFEGNRLLLSGPLPEVEFAVKSARARGTSDPILVFDDRTGRPIDYDARGVLARPASTSVLEPETPAEPSTPRGRGRPKLGVVAREVTLLPRHWDWLNSQPGGASVALRKLVEQARKTSGDRDRRRSAQESAYRFMSAMGGDLPGFEEASRALFADDRRKFGENLAEWPPDLRDHAVRLAFADLDGT